jgi:hypothetical protein
MIFFSVGELTLALPLVVLASVLLTQPAPWSGGSAALAIASTGLLIFSHQAIAPCAVLLGILAIVRIRLGPESTDTKASIVVLMLSVAVLGGAVWTLIFWPNPNSDTFVNIPSSTVVLLSAGLCLIGWAVLHGNRSGLEWLRWALVALAVPLTLYGIFSAIRGGPLTAYFSRGPCLILVAALQLLLLFDWLIRIKRLGFTNWTVKLPPHATPVAAVFLVALMAIPIVSALRWSTVVDGFRQTITHRKGFVPASSITTADSSYLWPWTNTTMSVILRSSNSNAVVENTIADRLFPFSIGSAEQQLPAVYRWDRLGLLTVTIQPAIGVVAPSDGATVSGQYPLDALASTKMTSVTFELTGGALSDHVISKAIATPYGWIGRWNTHNVPNGTYTLRCVATPVDHANIASAAITITVINAPATS